jgi:glyoxylase-like metal-dependent hydrolase (beta-lactamase superfamily II)/rhodanese-related sulfurtransferase
MLLVNAFTITRPLAKRETSQARLPVALSHTDDDTLHMPGPAVPQISPDELAHRLDRGEPLQLLDIRASERVAQGAVTLGATLDFRALPASQMYALPGLDPLALDPRRPVAVICGHGNSSRQATLFLRSQGFDAYTVTGGMAAWETVYLPRVLSPTSSLQRVVQLDRVGKGALSYVLVSDGDAVVVDPGRHVERYDELLRELEATPAAVVDTHMHADYLSGARAAAARWQVPYFLHPDDARSPYDGSPGRFTYQPVTHGDTIAVGRATLRVEHVPGHTLGSIALLADDALALTGDFLFVQSMGRPDLGGERDAWARLQWHSLARVRNAWPGNRLVLPAHYAGELERRADRAVAARLDVITATNAAVAIREEAAFLRWVADNTPPPPETYRTIKLANLGLLDVAEADAEILEFGPNQCAVR